MHTQTLARAFNCSYCCCVKNECACTHLAPQCLRRRAQVWQTQSLIEPISVNFHLINLNLSHSLRRVLVFQFSYIRHAFSVFSSCTVACTTRLCLGRRRGSRDFSLFSSSIYLHLFCSRSTLIHSFCVFTNPFQLRPLDFFKNKFP
jgi:hypothetical protein